MQQTVDCRCVVVSTGLRASLSGRVHADTVTSHSPPPTLPHLPLGPSSLAPIASFVLTPTTATTNNNNSHWERCVDT